MATSIGACNERNFAKARVIIRHVADLLRRSDSPNLQVSLDQAKAALQVQVEGQQVCTSCQ
jgi:hypothetical protein